MPHMSTHRARRAGAITRAVIGLSLAAFLPLTVGAAARPVPAAPVVTQVEAAGYSATPTLGARSFVTLRLSPADQALILGDGPAGTHPSAAAAAVCAAIPGHIAKRAELCDPGRFVMPSRLYYAVAFQAAPRCALVVEVNLDPAADDITTRTEDCTV